ncbi:kelch repeat-containing protein [Sediminibacter sp. Hel_I_10]|uniref:kelch repeat-containing protein n=1 Tax=Sediminibacter sp. Hel_I_10 TaxID=1392490 RepID=UPI0004792653|nr:kelch repeat-containing protein [Sediminibacter sp. Hel_I_10]
MKKLTCLPILFLTALLFSCDADDDTTSDDPVNTLTLELTEHTQQDQIGDFAENAMVEFNGYVWSTGGYNAYSGGERISEVWRSANGIAWESVTYDQFEARSNHTLTVFDGKMWLIGGIDNTNTFLEDVWYSSDGETWVLATDSPAYLAASYHSVVVFNNRLYLIKDGVSATVVWSSADGVLWEEETSNAFPSREDFEAVVFNNELYVLGGFHTSTKFNEIWKSSDGISWSQVATNTVFSPRNSHTATVYEGKVFVAGGINNAPIGELWYSEDMVNWFEYTPLTSTIGLYDHAALNYAGEIYLWGGREGSLGGSWPLTGKIRSINQITP